MVPDFISVSRTPSRLDADTGVHASTGCFRKTCTADHYCRPDGAVTGRPLNISFGLLRQAADIGRVIQLPIIGLALLEPIRTAGGWCIDNPPTGSFRRA